MEKMSEIVTIDRLLNLVPDSPDSVLSHLRAQPELASKQDSHGYSLIHAATSYEHLILLRALVQEYHVDPNIRDEDGETALFNAETKEFAKELVDLGVQVDIRNHEGQTAAEKLDDEDEQPEVAAYLKEATRQKPASTRTPNGIPGTSEAAHADLPTNDTSAAVRAPPPLPEGLQVSVGTMQASEVGDEPDPEFRRRIEELAARENFDGDESQRELRDLVSDAVSGMSQGSSASRRRLG